MNIFNPDFDIAALLIVAIAGLYSRKRCRSTPSIRFYRWLLIGLALSSIFRLLASLVIIVPLDVPMALPRFLFSMHYVAAAASALIFAAYIKIIVNGNEALKSENRSVFLAAVSTLLGCLLLYNMISPTFFDFTEERGYITLPAYSICPLLLTMLIMYGILLAYRARLIIEERTFFSLALASGITMGGIAMETVFPYKYAALLFTAASALSLLLFIEIPDFSGYDAAMQALQKEKAENERISVTTTSFINGMGHEIRTPVTSILGLNEMVLRETTDPNIASYARDIKSSADALLGLLNDILDFSEALSGDMEIKNSEYEFPSLINDLRNLMSLKALDKGLYLVIRPDASIPQIMKGDHVRLKQILVSILSNSVNFTEKGGITLTVSCSRADANHVDLRFDCKDTGTGIRTEDREKVFIPFMKLSGDSEEDGEGSGIGMSYVRNMLLAMGSDIEIQSIYGVGSICSFTLRQEVVSGVDITHPAAEESDSRGPARQLYRCKFTAPKARILVVDDAPSTLKVFRELLKQTGIRIDTAASGAEAVGLAAKETYHAIFVDQLMPEMDGIETMQAIRDEENALNIGSPIIAMTAADVQDNGENYIYSGFNGFLAKPLKPEQLENILIHNLPQELVTLQK